MIEKISPLTWFLTGAMIEAWLNLLIVYLVVRPYVRWHTRKAGDK